MTDDELDDLSHSAIEEALSFGLDRKIFLRYFKTIRDRATPATAQPEADARKAFEAWAVRNWFAIHRNGNAQFVNTATQHAWNGWKGASEAGAAAPAEGAAQDAARYRRFFDAGLPITFMGAEYEGKSSLDAAIDADLAQEGKI